MRKIKYSMVAFFIAMFILVSGVVADDCWSEAYSPNVHWVFCIDTSGSMKAKGHRDLLKLITQKITSEFIDTKKNIIKAGDRITIFSFDQEVRLEVTALYQAENDILPIRERLKQINKRNGGLTFISEAIVQAINLANKYRQFFHTNALYVFTDGKSEPYSPKWPKARIHAAKLRDKENFEKISLLEKDQGLNVWVGVLKWEAFNDAKSFVKKMGRNGHLVDLTDFSRLSLEKALNDFAQSVRSTIRVADVKEVDFGTIPFKSGMPYEKTISWNIQTDEMNQAPSIVGRINFDPDNPSELKEGHILDIKSTADKMVLNFKLKGSNKIKPGTYKGELELLPSQTNFGALKIEPSHLDLEFKKAGLMSYYIWRILVMSLVGFLILFYLTGKIKRKMPIRV